MLPSEELAAELKATGDCNNLLKDLPSAIRIRVVQKLYQTFSTERDGEPTNGKHSALSELVESEEFRALKTGQDRYLELLRFLQDFDSKRFMAAASDLKGTKRNYFAATKAEIEQSGTNTNPQQISPEGWWADVNCDTNGKRSRLKKIMQEMGFLKADCSLAVNAIH